MEELESINISSEYPWNAPLIVVSKKPDAQGNKNIEYVLISDASMN